MYQNIKKYIYKLDPETAHNLIEKSLYFLGEYLPYLLKPMSEKFSYEDRMLEQKILGMTFQNPVGLAAGFDKNASMLPALKALGFGFVEFGTVTPRPQEGNPKPRLFRYPKYNSIQNAMGFNNEGFEEVKSNLLKHYSLNMPIAANIGKNRTSKDKKIVEDYEVLIDGFKDISDFLVINLSSPNTPGLRDLQSKQFIEELFCMAQEKTDKPLFLKIAPDLDIVDVFEICHVAIENGAKGIVATNTTTDYSLLPGAQNFGGISGEVLCEKSFELFEALAQEFFTKTVLVSVGGISSAEEVYRRLKAGASLVELYSALIFEGPSVTKNINCDLLELMKKDGFKDISEVIGIDRK